MTAQPHPLRCDTCQHYKPTDERHTGDCDILNHWLTSQEYHFTFMVGCASHSNAPAPTPAPDVLDTFAHSAYRFLDAFGSDDDGAKYPIIHDDKVISLPEFLKQWKHQRTGRDEG